MKLSRKRNAEGFYEAFSDLIFATMAIFVLLFIVIMTQVNPPPKPQKAVDLVVAIDVSGSMGEPLQELIETLRDLSRNFPRVIKDFRIGVVAYSQNYDGGAKVFPLTSMTPDNVSDLDTWLASVSAGSSRVDTTLGIDLGIRELQPALNSGRRKSLVLIGDVGPYEAYRGIDLEVVNDALDNSHESEGYQLVGDFVAQSPENRVLTIFTSRRADQFTYPQSRNYFCQIARAAGSQGRFTDAPNKLVWELLESFLAEEEDAVATNPTAC